MLKPEFKSKEESIKKPDSEIILVSACLVGVKCRYDGGTNESESILELIKRGIVVPVCPEQLGGLPTPRPPAWFVGGTGEDVIKGQAMLLNAEGEDVSDAFIKGAEETLRLANILGAEKAILKQRSPSCGYGQVYLGETEIVEGNGVTAALLTACGIKVIPG